MFHSVKSRIVAAFAVALLIVMVLLSIVAFRYLRWYEYGRTDKNGVAAAQTAAAIFAYAEDADIDSSDPDRYDEFRKVLRGVCEEYEMAYLYAYECDLDNNTLTYRACVAADDVTDAIVSRIRSNGTVVPTEFSEVELKALEGQTVWKAIEYDNEMGHNLDWVSLVPDGSGKVLAGASYSVKQQYLRVIKSTISVLIPFAVALLLILGVQLAIVKRYLFDPISLVADRMRSFSIEGRDGVEPIRFTSNDEIEDIAEAFETMAKKTMEYVDNIEDLTKERVQANVELDVARRIQFGMVPANTRLEGTGFEVCAFSRPARAVGGDFYDVTVLEDGRVVTVVGDVSGKGVAAALFMAMAKTTVHDAFMVGCGPAEALKLTNESICAANPEGMFVTVFACVLDPATGEVRYANAGHMPPVVVGKSVEMFDADPGVLVGLFDDAVLEERTIRLEAGQTLLVYTDGAVEAVSVDRKFLGKELFEGQIADGCPYAHASEVIDRACLVVDEFTAGCEQFDDLTLVALMRTHDAGDGDLLAPMVEVAPDLSSLGSIRSSILSTGVTSPLKRKACLVAEELFVNIVSYAGSSKAWFAVEERDTGQLRVTLVDNGTAFDPTQAILPGPKFEDLENGGMGIGLVRELSADVRYQRLDGRNILVFQVVD